MFKQIRNVIIILLSLTILTSCDVEEVISDIFQAVDTEESINDIAISDLENTSNFRKGALEHILEGELNHKGEAVGFHYDRLESKKGEIITNTKTDPNEYGVYEAKVKVSGVEKTSNRGRSTFFPDEWSAQEVVDAINEAYANKEFISGNTYEGLTEEGQVIRMYLDQTELIISSFPVY